MHTHWLSINPFLVKSNALREMKIGSVIFNGADDKKNIIIIICILPGTILSSSLLILQKTYEIHTVILLILYIRKQTKGLIDLPTLSH